MIPDIRITCNGKTLYVKEITVRQYIKYLDIMQIQPENVADRVFLDKQLLQMIFCVTEETVNRVDVIEFITAIRTVNIIMQELIEQKLIDIAGVETVEREQSAFDEYDIENGYEDEEPESNGWKDRKKMMNQIIKISIRLCRQSYSECMKEDILSFLDYMKFELDNIND